MYLGTHSIKARGVDHDWKDNRNMMADFITCMIYGKSLSLYICANYNNYATYEQLGVLHQKKILGYYTNSLVHSLSLTKHTQIH